MKKLRTNEKIVGKKTKIRSLTITMANNHIIDFDQIATADNFGSLKSNARIETMATKNLENVKIATPERLGQRAASNDVVVAARETTFPTERQTPNSSEVESFKRKNKK